MTSCNFQHDGAPPHFTIDAKQFLKNKFDEKIVITRDFPKIWPARSPDFTPLDFYFWGTLKSGVYAKGPFNTLSALKIQIETEIESISQDEISNVIDIVLCRYQLVMELKGDVFEHFK